MLDLDCALSLSHTHTCTRLERLNFGKPSVNFEILSRVAVPVSSCDLLTSSEFSKRKVDMLPSILGQLEFQHVVRRYGIPSRLACAREIVVQCFMRERGHVLKVTKIAYGGFSKVQSHMGSWYNMMHTII